MVNEYENNANHTPWPTRSPDLKTVKDLRERMCYAAWSIIITPIDEISFGEMGAHLSSSRIVVKLL